MTDQLNTQVHDTEVEDICAEIAGTLEGAYDLLLERREAAFAAAVAPLDTERDILEQEHAAIGEKAKKHESTLEAAAYMAKFEAARLTLEDKGEEAGAKLREAEEAASVPANMRARQSEISDRIAEIERQKKTIAKRVFAEWYPECQQVIRAAERGLFCTLLDGLNTSFYEYQERTGTGGTLEQPYSFLVKNYHLENLTAAARSAELNSASRWYGGRVR